MKTTHRLRGVSASIIIVIAACILAAGLVTGCRAGQGQIQGQANLTNTDTATGAAADDYFDRDHIPPYSGSPYVILNDNIPSFTPEEMTTESFETYSELDQLGRCGVATACIGREMLTTEEREPIDMIRPSGWHTAKYSDRIDQSFLYNRCHLIAYQLAGENANERNLITGTRYFNTEGMFPFEDDVAHYIYRTQNHVLYRVTPVFQGDNLVASGVIMEAKSVEDDGEGICFHIYVYNVQPGVLIDYRTGDSELDPNYAPPAPNPGETSTDGAGANNTGDAFTIGTGNGSPGETLTTGTDNSGTGETLTTGTDNSGTNGTATNDTNAASAKHVYILNKHSKKFHYPNCLSVNDMNPRNRVTFSGNRDELISQGYTPCRNCKP